MAHTRIPTWNPMSTVNMALLSMMLTEAPHDVDLLLRACGRHWGSSLARAGPQPNEARIHDATGLLLRNLI